MSMLIGTAKTKLYIGTTLAADDEDMEASDFSGQSSSWVEIKGTTNLGSAGDTSELVTSNQINSGRTRKIKGTRNSGSMQVVADLDLTDQGQLALVAAEKTSGSYAFRIVFNDAPAGGKGSERLFVAYVMSTSEAWNEANSVISLSATLEIDSNVVRVAASSGA